MPNKKSNGEALNGQQQVYVPDNIWGWDGLARAERLKRSDPAEYKGPTTPRLLERMVHVSDLRHSLGDD